ncbi:MAG: transglutaminase family protein [Clostridiaceae bacterium]
MFEINPITFLLILLFLYPMAKGFLFMFSSHGLKGEAEEINRDISLVVSLLLGIYFGRKIFLVHEEGIYSSIYSLIPQGILNIIEGNTFVIYAVVIPGIVYALYRLFKIILNILSSITTFPVIDKIERFLYSKKSIFKRIAGAAFQIPKGACYVILAVFAMNIFFSVFPSEKFNKYVETSAPYKYICKGIVVPAMNSKLARQIPDIVSNSFRIVVEDSADGKGLPGKFGNVTVYYNGVTLDEGVRSNSEIDEFSMELARSETNNYGKAQAIYNWVGNNITYDYDKATKVLNNDFDVESGAISAYETRKGICFDYACLYAAMCRANDINVRMITGEGFNGVTWVSHAWNQVYIPDQDVWINVDTTFYKGGNYFDSRGFELDHRAGEIAGEW